MTEADAWRPVPAELDLPASVYESRAGLTGAASAPMSATAWETASSNGAQEFFADVSQYQGVPIDRSYEYRQFSFRVCDGTYLDPIAAQNWVTAKALLDDPTHPLEIIYPYVVYRPGTISTVGTYLHNIIGPKFPNRVAPMIDAEPFGGQVVGNHSVELNLWASHLAAMTVGGQKSVIGYSYTAGFQELWPDYPPWLKRRTASYGTWDPGFYDWQYSGGTGTGGHPGWPHGAGPWQLCDMNVTQKPIAQIIADLGFTKEGDMTEEEHNVLMQNNTMLKVLSALFDPKTQPPASEAGELTKRIRWTLDAVKALPTAEEVAQAVLAAGGGGGLSEPQLIAVLNRTGLSVSEGPQNASSLLRSVDMPQIPTDE